MTTPSTEVTPLFLGQPLLGTYPPLNAAVFIGTPDQADRWLGNPPGTTSDGPRRSIAVTGTLTGPDADAVTAALQLLQDLARATGPLLVPTGLSRLGWDRWSGCWFGPTDLVIGPVEPTPTGYAADYRILFRVAGTIDDSGGAWHPPLTGLWAPQPDGDGTTRRLNPPRP